MSSISVQQELQHPSGVGFGHDAASLQVAQGEFLRMKGDLEGAVQAYRVALQLDSARHEAWNGLGNLFASLKDWATARTFLEEACAISPRDAAAQNNLGNILFQTGCMADALSHYELALAEDPNHSKYWNNYGNTLQRLGRFLEAENSFRTALTLRPDYPEAHVNFGFLCYERGFFIEAEDHYRRAVAIAPEMALAHVCLAQVLLARGEFAEGWREQEWRWSWDGFPSPPREFAQPQWRGEELAARRILVHAEQGLGDVIHLCRYIPSIAARGGVVLLEVHPELVALLASLPGVAQIISRGEASPPFDCHCPMLSLPLAFCTTLETIPGLTPYLHIQASTKSWSPPDDYRLKVGLVWSGSTSNANNRKRSVPLQLLCEILDCDAAFYSFQKGEANAQEEYPLLASASEGGGLETTAAALLQMDLVISVDTAIAHLAGALGLPVWILLAKVADWRWLLDRRDTPWYPTARLFRQQETGDWRSVIRDVKAELQDLLDSRETARRTP